MFRTTKAVATVLKKRSHLSPIGLPFMIRLCDYKIEFINNILEINNYHILYSKVNIFLKNAINE